VGDDGDAIAVLELPGDLMPEHRPGGRAAELLHVRAAEPTRPHAHEQTGAVRLGQVDELGTPV
jgi:hypothetical protein